MSSLEFAESRVGTTLRGKWHLDSLLGVGGMAAVYAATHRNGRRGAVKMLHPTLAQDPTIRLRFIQEGRAANAIAHPGIVAVLDDDEDEHQNPFLVMELLAGSSLEEVLKDAGGKLPWPEVMRLAEGILEALAAAHARGVIHRDLKPDNVFICDDGQLKLLDFGIARLDGGASATQTGTTLGTPAYMAPEQALGQRESVGPHTDVWAVGATLFTLLTGRHVHGGKTINETLVFAATRKALPVGMVVELPRNIADVIDRALDHEPERRYPDAAAMLTAVREATRLPGTVRIAQPGASAEALTLPSAPTPARVVMPSTLPPPEADAPEVRVPLPAPLPTLQPGHQPTMRSAHEGAAGPEGEQNTEATPSSVSEPPGSARPAQRRVAPSTIAVALAGLLLVGAVARLAHRSEATHEAPTPPSAGPTPSGLASPGSGPLPVASLADPATPNAPASAPASASASATRPPAAPSGRGPRVNTPSTDLFDRRR